MYAIIENNTPRELPAGRPFRAGDIQYPANALELMTAHQRGALNIHAIEETDIPDGKVAVGSSLTWDGSKVRRVYELEDAPSPPSLIPRSIAMWRARTIMKVTPWGEGTLFEAVQAAIAALEEPMQKAAAEEALERGSDFDRDGVFVPMLAAVVGISEEQMDELMEQAAGLPA
jgi:hypothetical protein